MAATRVLLAPLSGVFVATSLLYTFRHTIAVRTHDTALALHDVKMRLDDIDPDNWDKEGKERVSREKLRPAYLPPQRLSVTEEVKARWNEQFLAGVHAVSNANYYDLLANGLSSARSLARRLTSQVSEESGSISPVTGKAAAASGSGLVSTAGVSLREPTNVVQETIQEIDRPGSKVGSRLARSLGIDAGKVEKVVEAKTGPGLGQVGQGGRGRTYYLGEGTSLR
ncbi:uncharacterized protein PFL1_01999 [Pseudozyma flocculosa PF-1]|uniref:MICOS complex subunit MIC12 n=1 Tax=Pseudozyma flocculosa TaxID=84751 RepID=A0A5C3F0V3_9BASI|nr:uncharacterized protein PFL1_01999 [Pseudozyma flocculosa PF-1]EPQ30473.1 hypothetical protein PFL1_01999 [Pseudozyma flocculosa PF-1]SPO37556.1 uncharacterized protein PSFLO_03031 [Pseudozyma flocculosa]